MLPQYATSLLCHCADCSLARSLAVGRRFSFFCGWTAFFFVFFIADTTADSDVRHVWPGAADGTDLRVRLRGEQRVGDQGWVAWQSQSKPHQILPEA